MRYINKHGYKKFTSLSGRLPEAKCKIPLLLCVLITVLITAVSCSNISSNISSSVPYFPVQKPGMDRMEALMENVKLEMDDNGCLRAEGYLLIWPYGYSLHTDGEEIQIINDKGQVVACVGGYIDIGGGEVALPEEEAKKHIEKNIIRQELPDGCNGPYWIVGEVISSDINTGPKEDVNINAISTGNHETVDEQNLEQGNIEVEEVPVVVKSTEELINAIKEAKSPDSTNDVYIRNKLQDIDYFYEPAVEFPGYELLHIEVNEYHIFYRYMPEEIIHGTDSPDFDFNNGIEVTITRTDYMQKYVEGNN
ncbi:MAG: hypothetical protein PHG41_06910, partial [Actinomycetota bacterium]|nr:hypothetical protein [Actinomycetota bacterium]